MKAAPAPLLQSCYPSTFLERGVAIPFTTPLLAGARARPAERGGTELIVPNPAGGRGVYILPWLGVQQLCRPTVHDMRLHQAISGLAAISPGGIRAAARQVATEGLAGRAALNAAGRAAAGEAEERLTTNFLLLRLLIAQVEPGDAGALGTAPALLQERAQRVVARIAPRLGRSPADLARALEELAAIGHGIGVPGQTPPPRLMRLLGALRHLRAAMRGAARESGGDPATQAAMIAAVAELTMLAAERMIADAHALYADMAGLVLRWYQAGAEIAAMLARPDWLLDGWEQIALIWQLAETPASRRAALVEIAAMVPVLPRELGEWIGNPIAIEEVGRLRRNVTLNEDWRTGHLYDRIARNEALRALAA
ncbi:MAG: hypothetical protein KGL12_05410 [Rhodospirillales bacterium]|nr:hypothetical protein [Rhodospirillales bacterium]